MSIPTRTRLLTALVVPALLLGTGGCSGGDEAAETPEDALAAAKTTLDETPGVSLSLTTPELPSGVDGVIDATGVATHAPAFEGDIKLRVNNLSVDVPVVAVQGAVFAKLPFTTRFAEIDPSDYGAPDPADLMDPESGLSGWLGAAEDVTEGEQVRDGEQVVTAYEATIPGSAVASVIPSADASASFRSTFKLDESGRLVSAAVDGPFYGDRGDVSYTVTLSDYGTEKDISRP